MKTRTALELVAVAAIGALAHPLGLLLGGLAAGTSPGLSFEGWLFASLFVWVPLGLGGLVCWVVRVARPASAAVDWGGRAFYALEAALQLGGQAFVASVLHTDAQAAIAFIFVPLYAHAAAGLGAVVVLAGVGLGSRWAPRA